MNDFAVAGVYISEKGMYAGHIPYYADIIEKLAEAENMTKEEFWSVVRDMLEDLIKQIDADVLEVQGDKEAVRDEWRAD